MFGGSSSTSMKMTYDGFGEPVKLILEEEGTVVKCSVVTQTPEPVLYAFLSLLELDSRF